MSSHRETRATPRASYAWLLALFLSLAAAAVPFAARGQDFPEPAPGYGMLDDDGEGGGLIVPEGYTPPPMDIPLDDSGYDDDPGADDDPASAHERPDGDEDGYDPGESPYEPPVETPDPVEPPEPAPAPDPVDEPARVPDPAPDPASVAPPEPAPASATAETGLVPPAAPASTGTTREAELPSPRPARIDEEDTQPPPATRPAPADGGFGIDLSADPAAPPRGRINEDPPPPARPVPAAASPVAEEEEAVAANPEAEKLFEEGTRLFNEKKYQASVDAFRKAIAADPGNDVYKLALEMVESTLVAQGGDGAPAPEPAGAPASAASEPPGIETDVMKLGDKLPERKPPSAKPADEASARPAGPPRSASGSLSFAKGVATGDLKFWKGRLADIDGDTAVLQAGKGRSDFAVGFRIPGRPVKALAILTHATSAGAKTWHPLTITLNKTKLLDGTMQLKNAFADHVFDISDRAKEGINVLRFSQRSDSADYLLRKIVIFVQYQPKGK